MSDENFLNEVRGMTENERRDELYDRIMAEAHELTNDEIVSSTMVETNASDWDVSECEITAVVLRDSKCVVSFNFWLSGEPIPDKVYSGDSIAGKAEATFNEQGDVTFRAPSAEVEQDEEDHEDDMEE